MHLGSEQDDDIIICKDEDNRQSMLVKYCWVLRAELSYVETYSKADLEDHISSDWVSHFR